MDPGSPSEVMEPKYLLFRRWLYTPCSSSDVCFPGRRTAPRRRIWNRGENRFYTWKPKVWRFGNSFSKESFLKFHLSFQLIFRATTGDVIPWFQSGYYLVRLVNMRGQMAEIRLTSWYGSLFTGFDHHPRWWSPDFSHQQFGSCIVI